MSIEHLIEKYGYWAVFIGTLLEGETILIIGGFFAHQGYLNITYVIFTAFLGTLLSDQFFFFLGRVKGRRFLDKRPLWQPRVEKAQRLLNRYQNLVILGFRFLYGLRTITPFIIGMSRVKSGRFVILNIISALVWAVVIGISGYLFGNGMEILLKDVKHYEKEAIIGIIIVGSLTWLVRYYRSWRNTN